MKRFLKIIAAILLYLWQLPQNLLGLGLLLILRGEARHKLGSIRFYFLNTFPGGITLGEYIIVGTNENVTIRHEFGHVRQSRILGPLYLFAVGIPSIVHAWLNDGIGCCGRHRTGYYHFYTEKWADRLGGVTRCIDAWVH
ncbi:MAG: hypothetical protein NC115_12195 [Bacteroidales bacterium]|nr:hypothetical protein [Bacteroidales bacterium]